MKLQDINVGDFVSFSKENKLRPAVFFDRDGVLNIDYEYIHKIKNFIWIEGAIEAIKYLNDNNYFVFVVTNQSGIARGYYTKNEVFKLHQWMNNELKRDGAHIDAFYFCPHHPEAKVDKYRIKCGCRKPSPGLILKALREWPVDKSNSFSIGDKESDVKAAINAGIQGYLFKEGNLYHFLLKILQKRNIN